MKPCSKCKVTKPYSDFCKEKRVAGGYEARCKACKNAYKQQYRADNPSAEREYYEKNKERLLTQRKLKYATNDTVRQAYQAQMRQYYAQNREVIKANVKAYAAKNKDKIREYHRKLREDRDFVIKANERSRKYRANPLNSKVLAHRTMQYYSRKYQAEGFSTKAQLQARWDYYGGLCWLCSTPAREMDHVKPLTKGGSNWPANLRPICRSCNARKSNNWPIVSVVVLGVSRCETSHPSPLNSNKRRSA